MSEFLRRVKQLEGLIHPARNISLRERKENDIFSREFLSFLALFQEITGKVLVM